MTYVLLKISVAFQSLIEADEEWAASKAIEDPNAVVANVHRTHFTHVGGITPTIAKTNIQESFNALEQGPSRSISEFKKEIDTLGLHVRQAFPATANDAYMILAKVWKSFSARVAKSRGIIANGSVFMIENVVQALASVPSHAVPNKKP